MPPLPDPGAQPPSPPQSDLPAELAHAAFAVRWLSPGCCARTGVLVAISELFGAFADRRELQRTESGDPLDLSDRDPVELGEPFWLDYVADIGTASTAPRRWQASWPAEELELGGELLSLS